MDSIFSFVRLLFELDLIAAAIVFAAGMLVAPVVILVHGAHWWRRRLKWAAVALLTSWFGLWLYWRHGLRPGER